MKYLIPQYYVTSSRCALLTITVFY